MQTKTIVSKSILSEAKASKISSIRNRQIRRAIYDIQTVPVETLCKRGKAKRINATENQYLYRAGRNLRIIFGVDDKCNTIYRVVDTKKVVPRSAALSIKD